MEWFFDGLGTEIVSVVISSIIGGLIGYKIGVKKTTKQIQQAGDKTNQKQMIKVDDSIIASNNKKANSEINLVQSQKAGNKSSQTQIGEIKNVGK